MTKNLKKYTAENFFKSKTTISLSLGLHKGRPSYKRSLQLSKENIQHLKTWNLKKFSTFVGHFCTFGPFLTSYIWIRIPNSDPDLPD
jgi:hypothetical protein